MFLQWAVCSMLFQGKSSPRRFFDLCLLSNCPACPASHLGLVSFGNLGRQGHWIKAKDQRSFWEKLKSTALITTSFLAEGNIQSNDYSTCLCTVDGVTVPHQPYANHSCDCKWLLGNSYAIYCTQVGRVIIDSEAFFRVFSTATVNDPFLFFAVATKRWQIVYR